MARARVSRTGKCFFLTTSASRTVGAAQSALSLGGCGREIAVLASCSLQFAEAGSAAMLLQQKKSNSADAQRVYFRFYLSWQRTFVEFESLADRPAVGAPPPMNFS